MLQGTRRGLLGGGISLIVKPDSAFDFVPFRLLQSGSGIIVDPSFSLRTYANITVVKTYYLNTVTGSDAANGTTAGTPKKTWNNIIGTGDYDRIIIQTGSYLIRSESSLQPSRNLEVIGEGTVYFTSDRSNNLGAWSLAAAQTFTFQSTVAGGEFIARVFDEGTLDAHGKPTLYTARASIALVEANAGSYFWSAGVLYVRTLDGLTPSGRTDLKYYDSSAINWAKNSLTFYIENVNFRGGTTFRNASATGGHKAYIKDCTGHLLSVQGVSEFIAQGCEFFTNGGDVANYDLLNTVISKCIEIDCEFYDSGLLSTDQASTSHNGCPIVRINGEYHHVTGQCAAEANTTTKAWMLGCELHHSTSGIGYFTQGTAWLDTCNIHDVTSALETGAGAIIYVHNLTSNGVFAGSGTVTGY